MKRTCAFLVVLSLLLSMCSFGLAQSDVVDEKGRIVRYGEPVHLTAYFCRSMPRFNEGDDINHNVWIQRYKALYNIELEIVVLANGDDYKQKIYTLLQDAQNERMRALPWLQNYFFLDLLNRKQDSIEHIQKNLDELQIPLDAGKTVLPVLIHMDDSTVQTSLKESAPFAVEALITRLFQNIPHAVFRLSLDQQVILFQDTEKSYLIINKSLEQFQQLLKEQFGMKSIIAINKNAIPFLQIYPVYYELNHAIENQNDYYAIIYCDFMSENKTAVVNSIYNSMKHSMKRHLAKRDSFSFFRDFSCLIENLKQKELKEHCIVYLSRLLVLAEKEIEKLNTPITPDYSKYFHILESFSKDDLQLNDCASLLENLYREFFALSNEAAVNRNNKMIHDLHRYIEEHLSGDLSLSRLGEVTSYNPAYLSALYKKITGYSLIDHINRLRIEKAKGLLKENNARVRQVALACGFESQQYFNKLFKQLCNMTPNEYRMQICNVFKSRSSDT